VAYFIWKKPFMAAGSDNFINELLKLNHFQNIYDTKGRYPAVAIEDIVAEGDPDFIFLLQNPILLKEDGYEISNYTQSTNNNS
jgi:ABC-type Fe3+-hydroxamate transport system substrate-binding protein